MLGWALKHGLGAGRDAPEETDDTQIEQPDTPAPVFAARAFKSALFGTPARRDKTELEANVPSLTLPAGKDKSKDARTTPGRPVGILLTPGTATARRKRVSFGREVAAEENDKKKELRIDKNARPRVNLFGDVAGDTARARPRTKLAAALENARRLGVDKKETDQADVGDGKEAQANVQPVQPVQPPPIAEDALWEEVDDTEWDPDMTVDLNEPHSQSGRYWKAQFQQYQEDARTEMGKLLKYKQLAKSFAKMKDAEAGDLQAKLQEEKERVATMESRISEMAQQLSRGRMEGSDRDYQELVSDLTRETARAVQYRSQVKELEAMMKGREAGAEVVDLDDTFAVGAPASPAARRRQHQHAATTTASPRTHRTLMEAQRELRRAREHVKDLAHAKDEARRLKSELRAAEQRARKHESESQALAADLAAAEAEVEAAQSRAHDLEKRAQLAEDERRQKDEALRFLQRRFDTLKDDAKARVGEAEQVLRRKNEEIAELRGKNRHLLRQAESAKTAAAAAVAAPPRRYESPRLSYPPQATAADDFSIRSDELLDYGAAEPQLPRQRLSVHAVAPVEDKENESLQDVFVGAKAAVTSRPRPKSMILAGREASREAREDGMSALRRRRGADALRTSLPREAAPKQNDEAAFDLLGNRFARLGDMSVNVEAARKPIHYVAPVAPAAAVSTEAFSESDRTAAAKERVERRREERRREAAQKREALAL